MDSFDLIILGVYMNKYLFRYKRVFTWNLELLYAIGGKTYSTIFEDSVGSKNSYLFWKGSFEGPVNEEFFIALEEWLEKQGMEYTFIEGER